jgi:hypothetical protein
VTEKTLAEFRDAPTAFLAGLRNSGDLRPELNGPNHIFPDTQGDHCSVLIRKEMGIFQDVPHYLWKPGIPAWKRFVPGEAI